MNNTKTEYSNRNNILSVIVNDEVCETYDLSCPQDYSEAFNMGWIETENDYDNNIQVALNCDVEIPFYSEFLDE